MVTSQSKRRHMPKKKTVSRVVTKDQAVGGDILNAPQGDIVATLNMKRERFCSLYASDREFFGNGVEAYAEAYGFDLSNPAKYKAAQAGASRLLKDVKVLDRIDELLEVGGLNDQFVDKQLSFVITQHADMTSKMQGIREYNKLKGRIIEKRANFNFNPEPLLGGDSRKKAGTNKPQDLSRDDEDTPEGEVVSQRITTVPKQGN